MRVSPLVLFSAVLAACPAETDTDTDTDVDPIRVSAAAECAAQLERGFTVGGGDRTLFRSIAFDGEAVWVAYFEVREDGETWLERFACDGTSLVGPILLDVDGAAPHLALTHVEVRGDDLVVSSTHLNDAGAFGRSRFLRLDRRDGTELGALWTGTAGLNTYGARARAHEDGWLLYTNSAGRTRRIHTFSMAPPALEPAEVVDRFERRGAFLGWGLSFAYDDEQVHAVWTEQLDGGPIEVLGQAADGDEPAKLGEVRLVFGMDVDIASAGPGNTVAVWASAEGITAAEAGTWQPRQIAPGANLRAAITAAGEHLVVGLADNLGAAGGASLNRLEGLDIVASTTDLPAPPVVVAPLGDAHVLAGGWRPGKRPVVYARAVP